MANKNNRTKIVKRRIVKKVVKSNTPKQITPTTKKIVLSDNAQKKNVVKSSAANTSQKKTTLNAQAKSVAKAITKSANEKDKARKTLANKKAVYVKTPSETKKDKQTVVYKKVPAPAKHTDVKKPAINTSDIKDVQTPRKNQLPNMPKPAYRPERFETQENKQKKKETRIDSFKNKEITVNVTPAALDKIKKGKNITQTLTFRIVFIICLIICSFGVFKFRASGAKLINMNKYRKTNDGDVISLLEELKEDPNSFIDENGNKIYYTLNVVSMNKIKINTVSADQINADYYDITGCIEYSCSERTGSLYNKYNVTVSDNRICNLEKNYKTVSGNMIDKVEVKLHDRNIESINHYLNEMSGEKTLRFTKQIYEDNDHITVSENEISESDESKTDEEEIPATEANIPHHD